MQNLLEKEYLENRKKKFLRAHTNPNHPLYQQEVSNGTKIILGFLNNTILAQARNSRSKYLYNLSSDKCFNNNSNNYSFSESLLCEKLLFEKDPVLTNIKNFEKDFEAKTEADYYTSLEGVTCAKEYLRKHKEFLLKLNFLHRYYYYFIAKNLFLSNN
jgi:hypothetical protein